MDIIIVQEEYTAFISTPSLGPKKPWTIYQVASLRPLTSFGSCKLSLRHPVYMYPPPWYFTICNGQHTLWCGLVGAQCGIKQSAHIIVWLIQHMFWCGLVSTHHGVVQLTHMQWCNGIVSKIIECYYSQLTSLFGTIRKQSGKVQCTNYDVVYSANIMEG